MAIENFKRVEHKYMLSSEQRKAIEQVLRDYMESDEYGEATITSVYLDTPNYDIISRSNEKPLYKEKLRYRAYGTEASESMMVALSDARDIPNPDSSVFLELKKKFCGIVYKRRVPMSATEARSALMGERISNIVGENDVDYRTKQIAAELDAALNRHSEAKPAVATICERVAWKPLSSALNEQKRELRVTFDSSLRYVDMSSNCCEDDDSNTRKWKEIPELNSDVSIMEIKCVESYPKWLSDTLAELEVFPQSFSKCGTAVSMIVDDME